MLHRQRLVVALLAAFALSCSREPCLPLLHYYAYDRSLPLEADIDTLWQRNDKLRLHVASTSVHDCRVTALWTLPRVRKAPIPAIIVQHGIGDSKEVDYVDISPKQIVGVSAALIPFLEHDDANRALMGSNMQRQAVPLIKTEPPIIATGMEEEVPKHSGMVVRARNAGTVTAVDAKHIIIDNAEEYELRKFVGLNEKTS